MLVREKTHLIQIGEEYDSQIKWHSRIIDLPIKLINGMPLFIIVSNYGRIEFQTKNFNEIEEKAKFFCCPCGRHSVESDKAYIYVLVETDEKEVLLGTVLGTRERKFSPMYDWVER